MDNELLEAAKNALEVLKETQKHGGGEIARRLAKAIKNAEKSATAKDPWSTAA